MISLIRRALKHIAVAYRSGEYLPDTVQYKDDRAKPAKHSYVTKKLPEDGHDGIKPRDVPTGASRDLP